MVALKPFTDTPHFRSWKQFAAQNKSSTTKQEFNFSFCEIMVSTIASANSFCLLSLQKSPLLTLVSHPGFPLIIHTLTCIGCIHHTWGRKKSRLNELLLLQFSQSITFYFITSSRQVFMLIIKLNCTVQPVPDPRSGSPARITWLEFIL